MFESSIHGIQTSAIAFKLLKLSLWLQQWHDYKLQWDPADYGDIKHLYVPSDEIWLPDIVLYNRWGHTLMFYISPRMHM